MTCISCLIGRTTSKIQISKLLEFIINDRSQQISHETSLLLIIFVHLLLTMPTENILYFSQSPKPTITCTLSSDGLASKLAEAIQVGSLRFLLPALFIISHIYPIVLLLNHVFFCLSKSSFQKVCFLFLVFFISTFQMTYG